MLACTELQKVAFATYMLNVNAEGWLANAKRMIKDSQTFINWEVFKAALYGSALSQRKTL